MLRARERDCGRSIDENKEERAESVCSLPEIELVA